MKVLLQVAPGPVACYTAAVCGVLALLFIGVPALEIYVLIKVGAVFGLLTTMGIIIATGMAGAALAKRQGTVAMRQIQQSLMEGERIGRSMVEAALVLVAGVMMLTPGFLTDAVGLSLLVPPIRSMVAGAVVRWGEGRVTTQVGLGGFHVGGPFGPGEQGPFGPGVQGPQTADDDPDDGPDVIDI